MYTWMRQRKDQTPVTIVVKLMVEVLVVNHRIMLETVPWLIMLHQKTGPGHKGNLSIEQVVHELRELLTFKTKLHNNCWKPARGHALEEGSQTQMSHCPLLAQSFHWRATLVFK